MINTLWPNKNTVKRILMLKISFAKSSNHRMLIHQQISQFSLKIRDTTSIPSQGQSQTIPKLILQSGTKNSTSNIEIVNEFEEDSHQVAVKKIKKIQSKETQLFFNLDQNGKLKTIQKLKQRQKIKELSIIANQLLFQTDKSQSQIIWCALEQAFISLLTPTKDQNKIRSLSKFLYSLGKSKRATHNYETQMALILPFSTHQSFTQIVTTISRMGGMSEEFSHIVEKLYWKRREEFSPLEMNLINYVLAKNGKKIDTQLVQIIEKFPLRSIVLMLRAYDMTGVITPQVLKKCIPMIISRKNQTNFLDFRGVFSIYCKYLYLDNPKFIAYLQEQYKILARNVNEQALEQVWEYFPQAVNSNKLPIALVQEIIKSLKILKLRNRIGERTWKKIALTFSSFENLEIRTQLQKI